MFGFECVAYKMNSMVNKFLLTEDKFMPELYLQQPVLGKYAACGPFTKNKKKWKGLKKLKI